ncbi:hypothetical protein EV210_10417 [Anaerospora hongkongensis]|uniref:Uncharacterized protein n=1 Tax=Anaerospora hongkongensis TaxID=244830 RepID=A0A4R1PYW3_9FIRM|nr:hypothetical protein EV210_10417 [Anaerospora hongkongensis]
MLVCIALDGDAKDTDKNDYENMLGLLRKVKDAAIICKRNNYFVAFYLVFLESTLQK